MAHRTKTPGGHPMAHAPTTIRSKANADAWARATHRAAWEIRNMYRTMCGLWPHPIPPPPRTVSGMTARQYRAARRAYRRQVDAYMKAVKRQPHRRPGAAVAPLVIRQGATAQDRMAEVEADA